MHYSKNHKSIFIMTRDMKDKLMGTLIVPFGLTVILVPFSMLIGWNLFTAVLFWLVITPGVSVYLPLMVSGNRNYLFESLLGLVIFYAMMVFMIYDHSKTDYFQIMILSLIINLILVSFITLIKKSGRLTKFVCDPKW